MTREEAGQKAKIMQAYADGKDIEYYDVISEQWVDKKEPSFDDKPCCYRVKADPKYRPFEDAEECLCEMEKHKCYGYVKYDNTYLCINALHPSSATIDDICRSYAELMDVATFADGVPFGIKEE